MELYFIRHGQSANNAHWSNPGYLENPDPSLTEIGMQQACHVSEFLKEAQTVVDPKEWNIQNRFGFGLTHIYTSLMERAVHTAAPTARALEIPMLAWKEIHEEGGIFSRHDKSNTVGLPGQTRSFFMENFPTLVLPEELGETGWWN